MALVGTAFVISTVTLQNREADVRWRALVASALTFSARSAIDIYEEIGQEALVTYFDRMEERSYARAYLFDEDLRELSGREPPAVGEELAAQAAVSDELAVEGVGNERVVAQRVITSDGEQYVILAEIDPDRVYRLARRGGPARPGGDRGGGRAEGEGGRGDSPEDAGQPGDQSAEGGRGERSPDFRGGGRGQRPSPNRQAWSWVWLSLVDEPGELGFRLLAVFLTAGIVCYGLARYLTAPVLRLRDATRRLTEGDLSVRVGPEVGNRRDELAQLGHDFDVMAERIESLLTSQQQLLSDVSHELRSPLARLNVALALARQRSGSDATGALDRIESEAEQLNSLIGRVLSLSRFESGASAPQPTAVDLARLVGDIAADADFEALAKGCGVNVSAEVPCKVMGAETLLRSAIENVVRNAVRYTAEGTDVDVILSCDDEILITVRDRGPGVPDDQLDELFEPFYRIADSRDRESGGTGLGLSIAQRAVRVHGGSVRALNAADGGLIVEIRLPSDGGDVEGPA
jgi:two-component system sensor histidine kinase CpxA